MIRKSTTISKTKELSKQLVESVLAERAKTHQQPTPNGYRLHATCTEKLMEICREQINWDKMNYSQRESCYMVMHKMARVLTGNPNHRDNWLDISGYATLIVKEIDDGII